MAEINYIYVRYHNIYVIEDCLSKIASFIYEVAFKIILKKIYFYHTYFALYIYSTLIHLKSIYKSRFTIYKL